MKAIVVRDYGPLEQLDYADMPDPTPGPNEVVVKAEAIGVNYPDGLLVQGLYQAKPQTPFVPGMEVAGPVTAVGSGVTNIKVGDRVGVLALNRNGGYAEMTAASVDQVVKLPADVPSDVACALMCGYGTSHHALKQRAQLKVGETLCVLGASGLTGLAAVQIGKAMGAKVIAVASSEAKREICRQNGADIVLGYENLKDELKKVTGGNGVDVAFDPVGGEAFDALTRSMAWGGRLLVIGFASGGIPKFATNLALLKGYSLVGVFWGAFTTKQADLHHENMNELIAWTQAGKIKPFIEGRYKLSEAPSVLERVLNGGGSGKLVLVP